MTSLIASPDFNFGSYTLQLLRQSLAMQSPFSGKSQLLAMPYAVWHFKGQFTIQDTYKAGLLRSFFTELDGQANTFRLPIPGFNNPFASAYTGTSGLINGANQTGTSLATNFWTPSTQVMNIGDFFTINDELKCCTRPVVSDGSGNATIEFKPALRSSPANGLQLYIGNAINLLTNNTALDTNYTGGNCTILRSGTDPFSGVNSFQISQNPANTNSYFFSPINSLIITQGKNVCASCYLKTGTYTGTIQITLKDRLGNILCNATATPTSSWARYSATAFVPTQWAAEGVQLFIDPTNDSSIPLNATYFASYPQVEFATSPSAIRTINTGDGAPYMLAQCIDDKQASWDMTPPIISQFNLEAIEAIR